MRFSTLTDRVAGEGVEAWAIYFAATEAKRKGRDILNLCIGDPSFDAPAVAVERACEALRSGDTHYADIPGRPALRAAIAETFSAASGLPTTANNVIFLAGAQNALFATCQCLFDDGDEVLVPEPMYVTYEATIQASGARLVRIPSPARLGFHVDVEALAGAVTPKTRGILYASPNNPTGAVMTAPELNAIAQIAIAHDLWVVADEVYGAITFDRPHISIAALPGMAERTATVSSLSKSHAMPGFRVGWTIGPEALIGHIETLSYAMLYGLPGFIQEAAIAAIRDGKADALSMRESYERRRKLVVERLSRIQSVRPLLPEGGMFVLLNVAPSGLSANDFAWRLLEEAGVAMLPADAFGPSARGHLRMSIGLDDAQLIDACQRIAHFAKGLEGQEAERRPA